MILSCQNLTYTLPGQSQPLLHDLSFELPGGHLTLLGGPNGSGKTTLCRLLCQAADRLESGKGPAWFACRGQTIPPARDDVPLLGAVFENPDTQLFMPTVADELAFGLENWGRPVAEIRAKVKQALISFGLEPLSDRDPHRCSGGEKQRIVLAAMFLLTPRFLLIDEGFSQMDEAQTREMSDALNRLCDQGTGILLIDHRKRFEPQASRHLWLASGILSSEVPV